MAQGVRAAIVIIGRNEGQDLHRCLSSAFRQSEQVIYVDSGSTDGSPELARSLGARVVQLDPSLPYTAARARNEGLRFLLRENPQLELVQFLDGDCELVEGWLDCAAAELENRSDLGAVCGQRRERSAHISIFNRICDLEWKLPSGEAESFGGDCMVRITAFRQVEGFNPALIAGEDPELSLRMRQKGWKIFRLAREMWDPLESTCRHASLSIL